MRAGFLAVLLLVVAGCFPSPGRDTGAPAGWLLVAEWDEHTRYVTRGRGAPAAYAGPAAAEQPRAAPRRGGRGTCTRVTIRRPGVIFYEGDLGPVIATVDTNLPPGEYVMTYPRGEDEAAITPWPNEKVVLEVALEAQGRDGPVFEAYLASMIAPASVPLRVVEASPATARGCRAACMDLGHLATGEARVVIDALTQSLPLGERSTWASWARSLAATVAEDQSSLRHQVHALLATGGPRALPRGRTSQAARDDPARQQSWAALAAWERDLWRAYLEKHGETLDVTDPARRDLHITRRVRFSMALRMSPQYMAPGARAAAEHLFNDPIFLGSTVGGISLYLGLLVAPEPIVSKATAVLTTVALVSLAGFSAAELVTVARAWMRLREESAQARTLGELERAARHFGHATGGSALRILAVLATVTVGKALPAGPPAGGAPATVPLRLPSNAGGAAAVAVADVVDVGWAAHVLKNGTVLLMATSAAGSGKGAGPGGRGGTSGSPPSAGHGTTPKRGQSGGKSSGKSASKSSGKRGGKVRPAAAGPGKWVDAGESMSPRAARYQEQITGVSPKWAYTLGGYKFDGYKNGVLLEAKGPGYKSFIEKGGDYKPWFKKAKRKGKGLEGLAKQAQHQSQAARQAGNLPVEWHVADIELVKPLRQLLQDNSIKNLKIIHTPYKP